MSNLNKNKQKIRQQKILDAILKSDLPTLKVAELFKLNEKDHTLQVNSKENKKFLMNSLGLEETDVPPKPYKSIDQYLEFIRVGDFQKRYKKLYLNKINKSNNETVVPSYNEVMNNNLTVSNNVISNNKTNNKTNSSIKKLPDEVLNVKEIIDILKDNCLIDNITEQVIDIFNLPNNILNKNYEIKQEYIINKFKKIHDDFNYIIISIPNPNYKDIYILKFLKDSLKIMKIYKKEENIFNKKFVLKESNTTLQPENSKLPYDIFLNMQDSLMYNYDKNKELKNNDGSKMMKRNIFKTYYNGLTENKIRNNFNSEIYGVI